MQTSQRLRSALLLVFLSVAWNGNLMAQTITWDSTPGGEIPSAQDGSGTWDMSSPNWVTSGPIAQTPYNKSTPTIFGVGGNAGTITIDASITSAPALSQSVTIASTIGGYTFNGSSLNSTSSLIINNQGGVTFNNAGNTFNSVVFGATMTGEVGGFSFLSSNAYSGQNGTVALSLQGTGTFSKSGAGTLILSGANTYSGTTTVSAGTLQIGNGGTTGSITSNVSVEGSLAFNRSDNTSFSNVISGNGGVTKSGAGNLTLTGTNIYTGSTTISAGTLQLGNGGTTGSITSNVSVNSGATLSFNRSNNFDFSNTIAGNGAVVQNGSGTVTLQAVNTYTGGTTVNAGTLAIGASERLADAGALTINSNAVFSLGSNNETVGSVALNGGSITGTGTLTSTSGFNVQSGNVSANLAGGTFTSSGNVVLTGSNSFSNTVINGGTLSANNTNALGTGTVSIASGATLSGNATVGNVTVATGGTLALTGGGTGTVSLASGSTFTGSGTYSSAINLDGVQVSPGNSPGTLTVNNALTATSSTVFNFELDGTNQTVGGGINDLIRLTGPQGNLTLDGILNITPLAAFTTTGTWRLFEYSGILTDNGLVFGTTPSLPPGMSFEINTGIAGRVDLIITAVPEPSSMMLVILGTAGLAIRRRARR